MPLPTDSRDLVLGGGWKVRLRPLRPSDRDLYTRAVIDLSPRSRYLRFLSPIQRPSEKLVDQMTRVDGRLHVAYVALTPDETAAVGVIRYVRMADDPLRAEVATAVADDWQGHGLGGELLRHSVEHARQSGLRALCATTLRENGGAIRLLQGSGFEAIGGTGPYMEHQMRLRR
jgi:acetyltransferase